MKCIFVTVFGHPKFTEMFSIFLESIIKSKSLDGDDIEMLLYTSCEYAEKIKQNAFFDSSKIKIVTTQSKNSKDEFTAKKLACEARLDFFDLPVSQYKTVLYLDTDIIIKNNLKPLIDLCKDDKLYVFPEFDITSNCHGSVLFGDEVDDYEDKTAFCSGIMLFNNIKMFKNLFERVRDDMSRKDAVVFKCFDQPYIVYHTFKTTPYDNKVLKNLIYNSAGESRKHNREDILQYADRDELIFHFCGPTTGYLPKKIQNMRILLENLKQI